MIRSGKELDNRYCEAFRAAGGDPEACEGVVWVHSAVGSSQVTVEDVVDAIDEKIIDGTADHGWLTGILALLWEQLSQGSRLRIMRSLIAGGAYKWLVTKKLTQAEEKLVRSALERDRATAALRRLDA